MQSGLTPCFSLLLSFAALPLQATILLPCSGANCPEQIDQKATASYSLNYQKSGALGQVVDDYCFPEPRSADGTCPVFKEYPSASSIHVSNTHEFTTLSFTADPGALKIHAKLTSEDLNDIFQGGYSNTFADLTVSQTYALQADHDSSFKYVFSFDGAAKTAPNGAKPFWNIEAYVTGKFGHELCQGYQDSSLQQSNSSGSKTWLSSQPVACTGSISPGQTFLTTWIRFEGVAAAGSSLSFDNTIDFRLYVPDGVQVISSSADFPVYSLSAADVPEPAPEISVPIALGLIATSIRRKKSRHNSLVTNRPLRVSVD